MLILTSDITHAGFDREVAAHAVDVLQQGGVIAYATDTCYGFTCNACDESALERLRRIKKMGREKPVSVMFNSVDLVDQWISRSDSFHDLAAKHWPGALTLIAGRAHRDIQCRALDDSVGCRMPKCAFSRYLVEQVGKPLTTTSANISGKPQAYSGFHIVEQFKSQKHQPDLIIDSGLIDKNAPSTIVDVRTMEIIRQGDLLI